MFCPRHREGLNISADHIAAYTTTKPLHVLLQAVLKNWEPWLTPQPDQALQQVGLE